MPGAIRFERELPAGSTLDEVVRAVLAELAIARDRGARESLETSFRTIAETRIIVVTSAKGGDGATTVAANLAASLAAGGRRVGLVEGDPVFGDLAVVMALPVPQPGMAVDPETGVRLVEPARPPDTFDPIDVDALIDQVSLLDPPFEVLVIDAPAPIAHRSGLTRMADHVLLVCSAHLSSIRNGVGLVEVLGHDNLGVVVNRIGRRGMPRHELEAALRAHVVAQLPVTPELVPDRPDQPPTLAPRKTPFAREIARLADALAPLKPPAGRSD